MKILVVGGGVIGLCCARSLAMRGAEVTVVERDGCGEGVSSGNIGWVSPILSTPLPEPGVMRKALAWMFRPDSPLLLRPRLDPGFLRWCWQFWRNCSRSRYDQGTRALVALNRRTLSLYQELRDQGVAFEMHDEGLIVATLSEHAMCEYASMFAGLEDAGHPDPVERLDGEELRAMEPALSDAVVGGFFARSECWVRPESLMSGLREDLVARGVRMVEQSPVSLLDRDAQGGWRVRSEREDFTADRVLVAAGIWSVELLKQVGVRLPLEAAKGYSITSPVTGPSPRYALYLAEAKVGCSPYDGAIRIAGTLELAGIDLSLRRRRVDAVSRAATSYLRGWEPAQTSVEWAGLRSLGPDGLPTIGAVPGQPGLFVAAGHSMLGITLGPATAAALEPLLLEDRLLPELEPFRVGRRI